MSMSDEGKDHFHVYRKVLLFLPFPVTQTFKGKSISENIRQRRKLKKLKERTTSTEVAFPIWNHGNNYRGANVLSIHSEEKLFSCLASQDK